MTPEPKYTNGRIRVRPDQIEYLDGLLHRAWVETSRLRAKIRDSTLGIGDSELFNALNRELRLIQSIQEEIKRTQADMER